MPARPFTPNVRQLTHVLKKILLKHYVPLLLVLQPKSFLDKNFVTMLESSLSLEAKSASQFLHITILRNKVDITMNSDVATCEIRKAWHDFGLNKLAHTRKEEKIKSRTPPKCRIHAKPCVLQRIHNTPEYVIDLYL